MNTTPATMPKSGMLGNWIQLFRVEQWIKNGFVFAALVFSMNLFHPSAIIRTMVAAGAFCLVSSSIYVLNDWFDRKRDALHPEKCTRPLACGTIAPSTGLLASFLLASMGLTIAFLLSHYVLVLLLVYVITNMLYSWRLKHEPILDVLVLASGYVLRVMAGAAAIRVVASPWVLTVTFLLALILGVGKRRSEIAKLDKVQLASRTVLSRYSIEFLDRVLIITLAATIVAYAAYVTEPQTAQKFGTTNLIFTLPFVVYGLLRYLYVVHEMHGGGNPTKLLLRDRPLQATVVGWILVVCYVLYAH